MNKTVVIALVSLVCGSYLLASAIHSVRSEAVVKVDITKLKGLHDVALRRDSGSTDVLTTSYYYRPPIEEIRGKAVLFEVLGRLNQGEDIPIKSAAALRARVDVKQVSGTPDLFSIQVTNPDGSSDVHTANLVAGEYLGQVGKLRLADAPQRGMPASIHKQAGHAFPLVGSAQKLQVALSALLCLLPLLILAQGQFTRPKGV